MLRKTAYPDWELYIDGAREDVLVAEPSFIAFRVDAGEHHAELVYSYWNWRHLSGLLLSIVAITLLIITLKK